MAVEVDSAGRRFVRMEIALDAPIDDVWRAVATGPGLSAWFVPTDLESRPGGAITFHLMPGIDSGGRVLAWQPPSVMSYEEPDWNPPAPSLVTECVVEPGPGGRTTFRMVHALATGSAEWDGMLEMMEKGWEPFFRVLVLYLAHFRGEPVHAVRLAGGHPGSVAEAWTDLAVALGLEGAQPGDHRRSPPGAPPLSGVVERVDETGMVLHTEEPAPGLAVFGTFAWGSTFVSVSLYLYGEASGTPAARALPLWQTWIDGRFPGSVPPG